jgi:hypothetical protein
MPPCDDAAVARLFRDPLVISFIDADNRKLAEVADAEIVPRVGENVRLAEVPYVVERVGYDIPAAAITHIWVVCRPT